MRVFIRHFWLFCICSFYSCSEVKKASEQAFYISITERLTLDLSNSGISSNLPFKVAPIPGFDSRFLLNHPYSSDLDTLVFNPTESYIKSGFEVPREGPDGLESFHFFASFGDRLIFLDNISVYVSKNGTLERFVLGNSTVGKEKGVSYIQSSSIPLGQVLSTNSGLLYFFSEDFDSGQIWLFAFDLKSESFFEVNFHSLESTKDHVIQVNHRAGARKAKVNNSFHPDLLVVENGLIVFYPYSADFQFFPSSSRKPQTIKPTSKLFKSAKDVPVGNLSEIDLTKFIEISEAWNRDIQFGPIYPIGDRMLFRMVRDDLGRKDGEIYLEVYDLSFKKVFESNISKIESDISFFYFPVGDSIFIKANSQSSEEILNYYFISLEND